MKIRTTRFGEVEVEDGHIVTMPEGVIGFSEYRKYALLDHSPESPFKWFQSVEIPDLAFAVIDPFPFVPDYKVDLRKSDLAFLDAEDSSHTLILVFVSIKRETSSVTANLLGPLVINLRNFKGKQVVLSDSPYSSSYDILQHDSVSSPENA